MRMVECDERQRLLLMQELGKSFDSMESQTMGEGFPIVFLVPDEMSETVSEALTKELRSGIVRPSLKTSTTFKPLSYEDLES